MGKLRNDKKRKYFKYTALAFLMVSFIFGFFWGLSLWEERENDDAEYASKEIFIEYNGQEYVLKENVETFLVLGLDQIKNGATSDSYNSNQSADFLMLFIFDNNTKKFCALPINRDTITEVNILGINGNKINSEIKQIALAYTHGNSDSVRARNTMDAVSQLLLESKINHYVSLKMEAVPIINDLLGGVEVTVLHDFADIDKTLVKGQKVTLSGEQALTYVQSRSGLSENDNISRMERQKQYLSAFYDKAIQCYENDESFIVDFLSELSNNSDSEKIIDSDTNLQEAAKKFAEYEFTGTLNIEGESKIGEEFMEFYADIDSIKELVIENFYELKR